MPKILVIEDQEAPWESLSECLVQLCGINPCDIKRARWYLEAEQNVIGGTKWDLILLDHRMPYDDPGCTDEGDFDRFTEHLQNIGYGLLPSLRAFQSEARIVGTSSLGRSELGKFSQPEHRLDKLQVYDKLPGLIRQLLGTPA